MPFPLFRSTAPVEAPLAPALSPAGAHAHHVLEERLLEQIREVLDGNNVRAADVRVVDSLCRDVYCLGRVRWEFRTERAVRTIPGSAATARHFRYEDRQFDQAARTMEAEALADMSLRKEFTDGLINGERGDPGFSLMQAASAVALRSLEPVSRNRRCAACGGTGLHAESACAACSGAGFVTDILTVRLMAVPAWEVNLEASPLAAESGRWLLAAGPAEASLHVAFGLLEVADDGEAKVFEYQAETPVMRLDLNIRDRLYSALAIGYGPFCFEPPPILDDLLPRNLERLAARADSGRRSARLRSLAKFPAMDRVLRDLADAESGSSPSPDSHEPAGHPVGPDAAPPANPDDASLSALVRRSLLGFLSDKTALALGRCAQGLLQDPALRRIPAAWAVVWCLPGPILIPCLAWILESGRLDRITLFWAAIVAFVVIPLAMLALSPLGSLLGRLLSIPLSALQARKRNISPPVSRRVPLPRLFLELVLLWASLGIVWGLAARAFPPLSSLPAWTSIATGIQTFIAAVQSVLPF